MINTKTAKAPLYSPTPPASLFTRLCLKLLIICLALYGVAVLILTVTSGWDQLIAIFPLTGAYAFNALLIVCSIVQFILIITRQDRLTRQTVIVMLLPPLIAISQVAWQQYDKWQYTRQWKANSTFVGGRYRPNDKDRYIRSVSATVYLPKWKNGGEVNIQTGWNKTLGYDLKYAPNQPDNVYRDGEDAYSDSLPNSPEHFDVYVHSFEGLIKQYVNPPYNCDIPAAIAFAKDMNALSKPDSVPCMVIGTNVQGAPIYGQDSWQNTNDRKYAVTIFDGNSLHLISQFGTAEKDIGGELAQLLTWQKDFRAVNPDDFGH